MERGGKQGSQIIYEIANVVREESKTTNSDYLSPLTIDEHKYSSLRKLLCITVYCFKFIDARVLSKCSTGLKEKALGKCKILKRVFNDMKTNSIYSHEIKNAMLIWIYVIQRRGFPNVFKAIQKHHRNCLQQLGLKVDDDGILRCHGLFANVTMNEGTKYPKLLPRYEYFTNLLICEVQQRLIHAGVAHTLYLKSEKNIGFHRVEYK